METMDAVLRDLEHYNRDLDYYVAHYDELLRRYPEHWVGIYGEQVAGADPDFDRLLADLQQRGIPPSCSFIEYLSSEPIEFLFSELILGDELLI
jgi:hypothetical protein